MATSSAEHSSAAPPFAARGVSVVGVRKSFGVTKALDGCSFHAAMGEIHAIFGGNGCGKSTLAKVMSGVLPIDAGQVSILGRTPTSPHEARAIGIANVFQEVLVADECTVLENLFLGSDALFSKNLSYQRKFEAAESLMAELTAQDIDPRTLVGALPLGTKQWITIGRALLSEPKVLILDESSAALDLDSTERLFARMRKMRDAGAAVIIVTHRMAELIRISDRATVLRDGRDVGVLEKGEITEANLMRLMTGKAASHEQGHAASEQRSGGVVLKADGLRIWPQSHPVSLRLHQGEILGVAGLDGQGQSDFVRILAGVDRALEARPMVADPQGGFAEIRNQADATEYGVAYVSGDRKREGIFNNLSIFENLLLPLYRRKARAGWLKIIDWRALTGAFDWEVEKLAVRMGERSDKITSLSGGNQQKVLIGRAFALNPNILVLNDPARGIDVGAKGELYGHLKDFASTGKAIVYLSSEIEEFVDFCTRVVVFRHGSVFEELTGSAIEPDRILSAMFGQTPGARIGQEPAKTAETSRGRAKPVESAPAPTGKFTLTSTAFGQGGNIPARYAENNRLSPPLEWSHPPEGTRSFALSITDPDIPEHFKFPRAFAHWMIYNIPGTVRGLSEGASPGGALPAGARELNSDFVTFGIPGFGKGYGGPWPPDARHRYVFTLYALKAAQLDLPESAGYAEFVSAVLPVTISTATLMATYGPALEPLPQATRSHQSASARRSDSRRAAESQA
jgi:ribose transport system ATP-binding protein